MTRVLSVGAALAVLACIGTTALATAQPTIDMNIVNNGKPAADVTVSAIINGGKQVVATTGSSGRITLDTSLLNIGKGTEVAVWIKTCEDGEVEVILVPEGEEGGCVEQGAEVGEGCGCRRAGIILWGEGPVTIDVGTGTVSQVTTGPSSAVSGLSLGASFDLRQMFNLEDVVGLVPGGSDASATSWAPGFGLNLEYKLGRMFSLGLEGGYGSMDTELRLPEGLQIGDLRYYEFGGNLKIGPPDVGQVIWPYVIFGLYRTWNKADFTLGNQTEYSLHKTRRDGLGAGFDYRVRPNLDLRVEGLYSSTFEDDDADEHIRWKFGLNYRPFARLNIDY